MKRSLPTNPAKILHAMRLHANIWKTRRAVPHFDARPMTEYNPEILTKLSTLTLTACYHNAGSTDQEPGKLNAALANYNIHEVELDILYFEGNLVAGHGLKSFERLAETDKKFLIQQDIKNLIARLILSGKDIHFDLKNSVRNPEALEEFVKLVNAIPSRIAVKFSGNNWTLQERVHERIIRPHITLFTVNGQLHSWEEYESQYLNLTSRADAQIGISMKSSIVKPEIIKALNKHGHFSQIYPVDAFSDAIKFDEMGVSGITSNNVELLSQLGKRELHSGQELQLASGF